MKPFRNTAYSLACATALLSSLNATTHINTAVPNDYVATLINLHLARAENPNINGSNVVVGVVDSVFNLYNPILQGKLVGSINNNIDPERFITSKNDMDHGTAVASLIVGNSDPFLGVANGAKYYGLSYINPGSIYSGDFQADITTMIQNGVKVINHSYANSGFPLINRKWDDGLEFINNNAQNRNPISAEEFWKNLQLDRDLRDAKTLADLSKTLGILNVVGVGNDGLISPRSNSVLPSYDESYRGLLAVGGLNTYRTLKAEDGKITIVGILEEDRKAILERWKAGQGDKREIILKSLIARQGIYAYSNFFAGGASLYGILAPAQDLVVANGSYNYNSHNNPNDSTATTFHGFSGTSGAAPLVTGAAALVEQKFPFLNGAQIADILLTTANSNIALPTLLVTRNVGRTGTANFYTILYISKEVPKHGEQVNLEQVKQDLFDAGFKMEDNDKTLAEYIVSNLLRSNADASTNDIKYPISVVKLEKEELIASGLLDVQNALKGLAAININRLNPSDIREFDKKYYAFYTIDTQGMEGDFTFTNTINAITWDDKYHLSDAINSLKDDARVNTSLSTLEAGFVKKGEGTLKFSGNTLNYSGPTLSEGGTLELHNVIAQNTALYANQGGRILILGETFAHKGLYANGGEARVIGLLNGEVFAQNNGVVSGNGTITQHLTNNGMVVPGGIGEIGVLNVGQTYTQSAQGSLVIHFNDTTNSDLIAQNYAIEGGKLIYTPVNGQFFQDGQEITITLSKLGNQENLKKFTSIDVLDTSSLDFTLKANTTIQTNNTPNIPESPQNPSVSNNPNSNTSIPELPSPPNPGSSSSQESNQSTTIIVDLKKDAYQLDNLEAQQALQEIRKTASQQYQNFFGFLDTTDQETKETILSSVNPNHTATNTSNALNTQNKAILNNVSFLTGNYTTTATPAKNSRLSLINHSATDDIVYDILQNYSGNPSEVSSKISYTHFKKDSHKSNTYSLDLNAKKWLDDTLKLGAFLSYSHQKGHQNFIQTQSQTLSGGLSALKDLGFISIVGGTSIGTSFNTLERYVQTCTTKLSADYQGYFASAQLGIAKDIAYNSDLTITPIAILNYIHSKQKSFEENHGIFAKGYEAINLNTLNASVGANLAYHFANQSSLMTTLNAFAFYTRRLNSDHFTSKEYFLDARENLISQNNPLNADSIYFGFDAQMQTEGKFVQFLIASEKAKNEYSINVGITAGLKF